MFARPSCVLLAAGLALAGCGRSSITGATAHAETVSAPAPESTARHLRATGTIRAVRVFNVVVPALRGPGGRLTLLGLIPNGAHVEQGDVVAEFDRVQQLEDAREARARVDDLYHQIEQNRSQTRAEAANRLTNLRQAEADLAKAEIELKKGETLSEIDRLKNEAKMEDAKARVASLQKSSHYRDLGDAAGLRILELQRDRQQVVLDRAQGNIELLNVRAPIGGMVAHENVWRNNSVGAMQEGDQVWAGQPLVRIFDPSEMVVTTMISETDTTMIAPGVQAKVRLDAYPGAVFDARYESASPVASSDLVSPIKYFSVRFRLLQRDPRLLPDLSAAVELGQ